MPIWSHSVMVGVLGEKVVNNSKDHFKFTPTPYTIKVTTVQYMIGDRVCLQRLFDSGNPNRPQTEDKVLIFKKCVGWNLNGNMVPKQNVLFCPRAI